MDAPAQAAAEVELLLAVELNGRRISEGELFLRRGAELLAPAELLDALRFAYAGAPVAERAGRLYYALSAFRDVTWQVHEADQFLALDAGPRAFRENRLGLDAAAPLAAPPEVPGLYLNYDLLAEAGTGRRSAGAILEGAAFGGWGVLAGSFDTMSDRGGDAALVRLDTTYTYDDTAALARWRVGDAIGRGSLWGRPARFGGVQFATNFDIVSGFLTVPSLTARGEAALPSTVDIYVDEVFRRRVEVPAGPFSIEDVPFVGGEGEVRMVVRDLLGRERVVTSTYYAAAELARPGLTDFSAEAGFLRRRWGDRSFDYGEAFAAGTLRHGVSDSFTGELRAELLDRQQTAGGSAIVLTPLGTLSASLAGSNGSPGAGLLLGSGLDYQTRAFSAGFSNEWASPSFVQLGATRRLRWRSQARFGMPVASGATFGVAATRLDYRDADPVSIASGSLGLRIGTSAFLSVSALHGLEPRRTTSVAVTLLAPLGGGWSGSAGTTLEDGRARHAVQVQKSADPHDGVGFRAAASTGRVARALAGVTVNGAAGSVTAEAARAGDDKALRVEARGGLVAMDGDLFATARLDDGFALVDADGQAGLEVYSGGRRVATTGADGRALVPRLRSYGRTVLRIDPTDLPMDVEVGKPERVVSPYFRSGVRVHFPIARSAGATLRLVQGGDPVPLGAELHVPGRPDPLVVGHGGEVFVDPLAAPVTVEARWAGRRCRAEVPAPPAGAVLPVIGPLECREAL